MKVYQIKWSIFFEKIRIKNLQEYKMKKYGNEKMKKNWSESIPEYEYTLYKWAKKAGLAGPPRLLLRGGGPGHGCEGLAGGGWELGAGPGTRWPPAPPHPCAASLGYFGGFIHRIYFISIASLPEIRCTPIFLPEKNFLCGNTQEGPSNPPSLVRVTCWEQDPWPLIASPLTTPHQATFPEKKPGGLNMFTTQRDFLNPSLDLVRGGVEVRGVCLGGRIST